MDLRVDSGNHGSGHTPVLVTSGAVSVALLVSTGDPFDLTGLEVRAHGEREDGHQRGGELILMVGPPPDESGRGWTVVRVSPYDRGAIGIGYSSLLIVTCDRIKNFQNLIGIVATTEQRNCEVQSHLKKRVSVSEGRKLGCQVSRRTAGKIERYHALRFI